MEDYTNVTLVKITKERTVCFDGEDFLMVDAEIFNGLKSSHIPRPYTDSRPMQKAILEILEKHPGSYSRDIRHYLNEDYDFQPMPEVIRGCLQRMRNDEKITVEGMKNQARWFLKEQDGSLGVNEDAR
jgi:hypothetical protein